MGASGRSWVYRASYSKECTGGLSRWSLFGVSLRETGAIACRLGAFITKNDDDNSFLGLLLLGRGSSRRLLGWLSEDSSRPEAVQSPELVRARHCPENLPSQYISLDCS